MYDQILIILVIIAVHSAVAARDIDSFVCHITGFKVEIYALLKLSLKKLQSLIAHVNAYISRTHSGIRV